ncbi:MAG: hypothetical protein IPK32_00220 [Verrucomicrobiaceae bacterium]|nr:hypothetical protein [Verrucomicrobiaceae bacterium]
MRRPHAICYFAVFFAMLSLAQAQQPPLTLDQMEAIYQRELSTRHIPLLTRHLLEVQRLAATATDKAPYEKEINSLQQLLKTGVIDLRTAKAGGETLAPMPMPAPALPRIAGEAVITLFPALAENATSTSTTSNVGQIEWRLDHIDAGQHDLHLEYAAPAAVLAQPMPLVLELGTEKIESTLPPRTRHRRRPQLPHHAPGPDQPHRAATGLPAHFHSRAQKCSKLSFAASFHHSGQNSHSSTVNRPPHAPHRLHTSFHRSCRPLTR